MKIEMDTDELEKIIDDLEEVCKKHNCNIIEFETAANMLAARKFFNTKVKALGLTSPES